MRALQAAVLPWAKKNHPEKYEMTLQVASNPRSLEAYLLRLLEIRWEEDVSNRGELPILALDLTSVVIRARDRKTGEVMEFRGKRSRGPGDRRIAELAMPRSEWDDFEEIRRTLDLEYVDG